MGKVDIKSAFIQTHMTGLPVYVKLIRNMAKYVVELFLEWKEYLTKEGVLYTKMLKVMYCCVQVSRLWFELLTRVLLEAGYKSAAMDECIKCKVDGEGIHIIIIYVDNLLILASGKEMDVLKQQLVQKFQWITMEVKDCISYLGMQISRWDNQFEV